MRCAPTQMPTPGPLMRRSPRNSTRWSRPKLTSSTTISSSGWPKDATSPSTTSYAVARGREWTGADALERGLVDELGGLRTAIRRAKILAGLDADADAHVVGYPGSSWMDFLRPRQSSQPTTASLPGAFAVVVGRSVAALIDQAERSFSGAHVLWLGEHRF